MTTTPLPAAGHGGAARPAWLAWFWAARPFSLTASITPVVVGTAVAWHEARRFDAWLFVLALAGSVAIQVGTNLTDEYADHARHGPAKYPAPHKVIQRGELSPRAVLAGLLLAFAGGIACGLAIAAAVGWPILAVGVASVAVAYLYSGGPKPLGDLGLGEATVFGFMGVLMVMAAAYVQTQAVTMTALAASLPVACLVTAVMHANNLRDMVEDRAQGKRTLAARLGDEGARLAYAALLALAYLFLVAAVVLALAPAASLLALVTMPGAVVTARRLWAAADRRAMNGILLRTAGLHLSTGLLIAAGFLPTA